MHSRDAIVVGYGIGARSATHTCREQCYTSSEIGQHSTSIDTTTAVCSEMLLGTTCFVSVCSLVLVIARMGKHMRSYRHPWRIGMLKGEGSVERTRGQNRVKCVETEVPKHQTHSNIDHGRPWSTKVDHGRPWSTKVDHGFSFFSERTRNVS